MYGIGFLTAIVGLWLMLPADANGSGFGVPKELVAGFSIGQHGYAAKTLTGRYTHELKSAVQDL